MKVINGVKQNSGSIENGVVFDTQDVNGYPTAITIYGQEVPPYICYAGNTGLYRNTLEVTFADATEIGTYALYNCDEVTAINFSGSETKIGSYAFVGADGLTTFAFPDSIEELGLSVFNNADGLTRVFIPATVTTIAAVTTSHGLCRACDNMVAFYCEAASKPAGWGTYWNYNLSSYFTVNWGVSRAEFEAL